MIGWRWIKKIRVALGSSDGVTIFPEHMGKVGDSMVSIQKKEV